MGFSSGFNFMQHNSLETWFIFQKNMLYLLYYSYRLCNTFAHFAPRLKINVLPTNYLILPHFYPYIWFRDMKFCTKGDILSIRNDQYQSSKMCYFLFPCILECFKCSCVFVSLYSWNWISSCKLQASNGIRICATSSSSSAGIC